MTRVPPQPRRSGQTGFALALVLWVLAGLTVVAVAVASSTRISSESVKLLRDRVRAESAFLSTSARVKIIAATSPNRRSYFEGDRGRIFVDSRPTAVSSTESVVMTDGRGLFNLNTVSANRLQSLLRHCGAPDADTPALADTLADYIDEDSLKRVNGAEAFEYRSAGLPEPRNARLSSKEELWRIKGWPAIRASWMTAGCDDLVTVRGDGFFNQNTAARPLLMADGMNEAQANALIDAREAGIGALAAQASGDGSGPSGDVFNLSGGGVAGRLMRIRHDSAAVEWAMVYELELTPLRNGGPWRVHEVRYVPRPAAAASSAAPVTQAVLPPPSYQSELRDRPPNAAPSSPFAN